MTKVNNYPMVSVCMLAYNREKYISKSLDSILMQKMDFDYEIVVGDNCSTDNTKDIILEYYEKYPGLFKLIFQKTNIGLAKNQFHTLNACTGKYIAILDADDYWTDYYKLQKQVDFLEINPDYGAVHTRANIVDENNELMLVTKDNQPSGDVFDYLIFRSAFIINTTGCFRKQITDKLLEKVRNKNINYLIDYYIWIYIALFSKIKYMNDITTAYRSHSGGSSKAGYNYFKRIIPYIVSDIINEKFAISKVRNIKFCKRFKYGLLYSRAVLSGGMKLIDKIKRSFFYVKHFYLIPTIFISFISKLYSYTKRHIQFKTIF